jgi:hypothetical protein
MIDSESREFIDWAFKNLDDEQWYTDMLAEVRQRFADYYDQPKDEFLSRLKTKMEAGAAEHGAPNHTKDQTSRQIESEFIDILGWTLVEKWNDRKLNKEH